MLPVDSDASQVGMNQIEEEKDTVTYAEKQMQDHYKDPFAEAKKNF